MGSIKRMRTVFAVLALCALVASASELQQLSNTDADTPVDMSADSKDVAVADEESSDVGEGQFGGAFGGALLTSGSFTMMAASGGFEEEESDELGEGQFGGALLTSGSFTMMTASGGFE